MSKLKIIPKQLTDKEELEKVTQETLAITKKNNKELSDEEKLTIINASKLNKEDFPIILPMRATIGFMVRNMDGKNQQAIEFIRAGLPTNANVNTNFLAALVSEFDNLDINSQNRVDCLDWLARKNRINPSRFLEALVDGITFSHNQMTRAIIASKKPDLAEKIFDSADKESLKSAEHKKLAAKVAGLIDDKPLVNVETGSKTTNNYNNQTNVVLSFSDFVKSNDKLIRGQNGEKEKDYVEGEIVNE
jgi:hypothetical protein